MWGQSKIAIAVVVVIATTTFASAQQSRKAILLSCSGDSQQVLAVQSSPGSPAVTLRRSCADAISAIISTPLGDEAKDWDIKVAYSDKKLTQFLLWETVRKSGPQGPKGDKGDRGDKGELGTGSASATIVRPDFFSFVQIDQRERRIVLMARDVGTGTIAGHALVYYNTQGNSGQIICHLGYDAVEKTVTAPPFTGVMELGSTPLIPTSKSFPVPEGSTDIYPNIDVGHTTIVDSTMVTCHALVNGDGKALALAVAEFVPISIQPGTPPQ